MKMVREHITHVFTRRRQKTTWKPHTETEIVNRKNKHASNMLHGSRRKGHRKQKNKLVTNKTKNL